MHFNSSSQSRSAWTEQEDDLLRNAVSVYGERSWANVAQMVPGRSSKSCSDRWRNFLSPDIEHPRKSPFTEWEIAVVVLAQSRYGNNWKAISMLLPGRTNRAVKNLFVGNLKWGARLPEIRNRFLEWGMTLEALLEIKPDRAGGPVKPRPGQVLPDGTNGCEQEDDDSPLSGSPASTSSAGSAWQSDMTEHPNGSPGSAGTSDRRRRADGEMLQAAGAAGQSSPLHKRRRGGQSPVLGGLQQQLQSPSLTPHPGALGPSFNGGSPTLGISIPGAMGPPANRAPGSYTHLGLEHHTGGEPTPTSELTNASEGCASLTPAGAVLTAGLAGGCFGGAGALALGIMQQPGGPRTNSVPCGGLQQLLLGGDGMAGRVASWHYPGQMFAAAGAAMLDPATAAAMAAARPASPFQQHTAQMSAVSAASIPGSLTSLLTEGVEPVPVKAEAAAGAAGFHMHQQQQQLQHQHQHQQQQQQHHHHMWLQQQQHMQHMHQQHMQQQQQHMHAQHQQLCSSQQDPAAAAPGQADMSALHHAGHGMHHPHSHQQQQQQLQASGSRHAAGASCQQGGGAATTASIVASAAMELALPNSPVLAGNILQDMRSNDSAGLHSMLDQILNEDLNMADSALALLGGSEGGSMPIAPQRSSAFDPPVICLPTPQEQEAGAAQQPGGALPLAASPSPRPQAPPPSPQGGVLAAGGPGMGGGCSSSHMAAAPWFGSHMAQQQQQQGSGAAGVLNPVGLHPLKVETLMHRAGSLGDGPGSQQQQQQLSPGPQALPSRPGSSLGMASAQPAAAGATEAAGLRGSSPSPQATTTQNPGGHMSMLCAQLQQENLALMHKLHQMETQMGGPAKGSADAGAASGGAAGPSTPGAAGEQGLAAAAAGPAAGGGLTASSAAAAPASFLSGFDALMPQLRPVLTRVGGSAGGVAGLSSAGLGSLGGAVADSPAQLINTAFLDDHGLLGGL